MMKTISRIILATLALVAVVWLASVVVANLKMTVHARGTKPPPPPPPPPLDGGTIYYSTDSQVGSMKPDGSAKRVLLKQPLGEAEVSRVPHGGKRWFLVMGGIANEYYPDGRPRQEFFAISSSGDQVQLTAAPTFQPNTDLAGSACPRWTMRNGIVDGRMTFVGRNWAQAADGSWTVTAGVFAADFDPESLGPGCVPQGPQLLPIVLPAQELLSSQGIPDFGFATTVVGCDWSPDGTRLVYALDDGRLYVSSVSDGNPQLFFSAVAAQYPRWSPVQSGGSSQILFSGPSCSIHRINEDGSGWITVIPAQRKPNLGADPVRWSPAGTYFVYELWTLNKQGQRVGTAVYRATASGGSVLNLTSGILWATPLGWMLP